MYKPVMHTVAYKGRNAKKASREYERDAPNWMREGYVLYSIQWYEEKRGCLSLLFQIGPFLAPTGYLKVVYQLAQPDTANNTAGVSQAH